jgi:ATP/ADP translocase
MQIIHSLSGYSILILTVVMSLVMIKKYGWKIKADLHPILGVIVLVAIFLVVMTGMIRLMIGKGMKA